MAGVPEHVAHGRPQRCAVRPARARERAEGRRSVCGRADRELDEPDRCVAFEREEALEWLRFERVVPRDLTDFFVEERGVFVVEELGTHREPGGEGVGLVWVDADGHG